MRIVFFLFLSFFYWKIIIDAFSSYEKFVGFGGLKITKTIDKNEVLLRKMLDYIFKMLK
jgi:hypothetical protein